MNGEGQPDEVAGEHREECSEEGRDSSLSESGLRRPHVVSQPEAGSRGREKDPSTTCLYRNLGWILFATAVVCFAYFWILPPDYPEGVDAPRVLLPDGRRIAYREQGVSMDKANYTLLVLHGVVSSRLAGIIGVKDFLLESYGVRLVTYDRPGYGQSDPDPDWTFQSSATDMMDIADSLNLGQKFWIVADSGGGPHAYAAMKYFPHRLAGVAMSAPAISPYAPGMTADEQSAYFDLPFFRRLMWLTSYYAPALQPWLFYNFFLPFLHTSSTSLFAWQGVKDKATLSRIDMRTFMHADLEEGMRNPYAARTIAREHISGCQPRMWGFHLSELATTTSSGRQPFSGPVHIWQGTADRDIPYTFQLYVQRMIPQVQLYLMEGEGHYSWFCYCDTCHQHMFETMFGRRSQPSLVRNQ